jgi:hypothetical protein
MDFLKGKGIQSKKGLKAHLKTHSYVTIDSLTKFNGNQDGCFKRKKLMSSICDGFVELYNTVAFNLFTFVECKYLRTEFRIFIHDIQNLVMQ